MAHLQHWYSYIVDKAYNGWWLTFLSMLLQHSVIRKSFKDDGCATRLYKAERDKCLLLEMKNEELRH